jgi:hypothetical protein
LTVRPWRRYLLIDVLLGCDDAICFAERTFVSSARDEAFIVEWVGWSDDAEAEGITRVLRVLLLDARGGMTTRSIDEVVAELEVDVDPEAVFVAARDAGVLAADGGIVGNTGVRGLPVTGYGRTVTSEFKSSSRRTAARAQVARQAILLWLYEQPLHRANHAITELPAPWGQYYGEPFDVEELSLACKVLIDLKLIQGQRSAQGPVLAAQLTTNGVLCVENYGGAIDKWNDRNAMTGPSIGEYHHNQYGGNSAVASSNVEQHQQQGNNAEMALLVGYLAGALRLALLDETLDEQDAQDLQGAIVILDEEAAQAEPDQSRIQKVVDQVRTKGQTLAMDGAKSGIGAFLGAAGAALAAHFGWG